MSLLAVISFYSFRKGEPRNGRSEKDGKKRKNLFSLCFFSVLWASTLKARRQRWILKEGTGGLSCLIGRESLQDLDRTGSNLLEWTVWGHIAQR